MKKEKLDSFGKEYVSEARDRVIEEFDVIVTGKMKAPDVQEFFNELSKLEAVQIDLIRRLVIEMIDTSLHHTLFMFEQSDE